jgi:hypothetical protein
MLHTPQATLKHVFASAVMSLLLVSVTAAQAQGIYTCTDARGRKLTADRPIPECSDREQKVLNPNGTVKATLAAPLTPQQRDALAAKEKTEQTEKALIAEEKRRNRALLTRYPNQARHDTERASALNQIRLMRQATEQRLGALQAQQVKVDQEMEFYQKEPGKAPPTLRRTADEVIKNMKLQRQVMADQDAELKRIDLHFEEDLFRLKQLWSLQPGNTQAAPGKTR